MRTVAIIQARMSSTRLPGKVLIEFCKKPVLEHIVQRLETCKLIDDILIATSDDNSDDKIEDFCIEKKLNIFRGSLYDVLDRYYKAAIEYKADAIIRITGDCPLIDPQVVDKIIKTFHENQCDLCGLSGEFPDGLDCSVFSFKSIEKAWKEAELKSEREHVGPYIEKNPDIFKIEHVYLFNNMEHLRWTLDTPEDKQLINEIYNELYNDNDIFLTKDILELLERRPNLLNINDNIVRNEGYLISLNNDKANNNEQR